MSDKITKTVIFEIEPSGDCGECKSLIKPVRYCIPFDVQLKSKIDWQYNSTYEQCQTCRGYLEAEKSKVKCDNCKYFIYDWMESECTKGNENTYGETFARDDWFCVNCQDWSE